MVELLRLDATHAVRVVAGDVGHRAEPVTASGDDWVPSSPGDGAGLAVLHRLRNRMAVEDGFRVTMQSWVAPDDESERAMGVDQTHASWVVGHRVVVKWMTEPLVGPHPAADRLRRLSEAGFAESPALVGVIEWREPASGHWVPVVIVQEYLLGAEDGWTWVLAEARRALGLEAGTTTRFGIELGRLTARMHLALAPDTPQIASPELARSHTDDALATFEEALALTADIDPASHAILVERRDEFRFELGSILRMAGHPAYPIHGDLHVGQVLRTPDGLLRVIDFDGNPTRPPALRAGPDSVERDLAGMWLSLENIGHMVRRHSPEIAPAAVDRWVRGVRGDFLGGWLELAGERFGYDEVAQQVYDLEQLCREFVYACRYLPGWCYVPAAALISRFR